MRLGLDVSAPDSLSPGVLRVRRALQAALQARADVELVPLAAPADTVARRWRQGAALRHEIERGGLAGVHSVTSAFPLRGPGKRVCTIHELPWLHRVDENADWRHRLWARLAKLRADAVVVPSRLVARDLTGRGGRGERIHVVPWAADARFADEPPPGVVDEAVLGRYRLGEEPFVLALGAVRRKKNLEALLHGAAHLRERGGEVPRLVITGPDTPDLRRDLGLASRLGLDRWVTTFERIEEDDLPSLLRLATATVVLSASEGFGLPVLESLRCGTPVLVAAGTAQEETACGAGFVVQPEEPAEVADALARALREREDLRYQLAAAVGTRGWDDVAADVVAIWSGLVGR